MTLWVNSVITIRGNADVSKKRLLGKIVDGIIINTQVSPKSIKSTYKTALRYPVKEPLAVLSIRRDLIDAASYNATARKYRDLTEEVVLFLKIFVNIQIVVEKIPNVKAASLEIDLDANTQSYATYWENYRKLYEQRTMALQLFSVSSTSSLPHGMLGILYSVISLEAILLYGERQENAYKFRLRGAYLLGKDSASRERHYRILQLAYNLRGDIVHSDDKDRRRLKGTIKREFDMSMAEYNALLVRMNQTLLKKLIMSPDIFDDIDEIILSNRS